MAATRIQTRLLRWYRRYGRASLPWRTVRNPYRTLVSEFMLAQTQVERVVPSFEAFVTAFPNFAALASAPLADVLRRWKGLGYNSRAVRLHQLARVVFEKYGGALPSDPLDLRALPGMGPYSVAAVLAFAFNRDAAPVDTNVRRIVHRLYYGIEHPPVASARELDERARSLVPSGYAHDWSSALMDLGASLCTARAPKCLLCPLRSGCAAAPIDAGALEAARTASAKPASPQNAIPYVRTRRFARGRIIDRLRDLPPGQRISLLDLHGAVRTAYTGTIEEVREVVEALERDGLISHDGESVALRE
ncbi:MAG: A/G-specific adenine glycosylase [Candidatus Cybelea sp.]